MLFIVAFLWYYVSEDVLALEAPEEKTLDDFALVSGLSDCVFFAQPLGSLLTEQFFGQFVASAKAFLGDVEVVHAYDRHGGLLCYGCVWLADAAAHHTLLAP